MKIHDYCYDSERKELQANPSIDWDQFPPVQKKPVSKNRLAITPKASINELSEKQVVFQEQLSVETPITHPKKVIRVGGVRNWR